MRNSLVTLLATFVSFTLLAQPAARIEYGKPIELRNVKSAYISTTEDEALAKEARRQLAERLPALTFAETEDKGDVTLIFSRKAAAEASDPKQVTTTMYVARATGGMTLRLYRDATSSKGDLAEAVAEVVEPAVNLLKTANPRQFGPPPEELQSQKKAMIHTTAALRVGMSKGEVLAAFGPPTKVSGRATYTQTWVYKTTDGDIRIVFGGERAVAVTIPEKK